MLFGDFLHEDGIVALGRHGGVGETEKGAESVGGEVPLAAAAFAAGRDRGFRVPGGDGFDGATHGDDLRVFTSVAFLIKVK